MLEIFRNSLKSTTVRFVLFGLLIASFALWGVGDIFRFFDPQARAIISVAGDEIDDRQFIRRYQEQTRLLLERGITEALIRQSRLEQFVIEEIVNEAVLKLEISALGFSISPSLIRENVQSSPLFTGSEGFDRALFDRYLLSLGLSEEAFIETIKAELAITLIEKSFLSPLPALPPLAGQLIHNWQEEKRDISYISSPINRATPLPDPGDVVLEEWLALFQGEFQRPEYRHIRFLQIQQEGVKKPLDEASLKAFYEENISDYSTSEQRAYDQYLFFQQEEAENSVADIAGNIAPAGGTLIEANPQALALISDPAIARNVFNLQKEGAVSKAFQGQLGWYVVKLKKIIAPEKQPFKEVRAEIAERAKTEQSYEALLSQITRIEDMLIYGATIDDIAGETGLEIKSPPAIDSFTADEKGRLVDAIPESPAFVEAAFSLSEGSLSDPVEDNQRGIFYVIQLDQIDPARQSQLEEIRPRILLSWQENERQKRAFETLEAIKKKIDEGVKFSEATKGYAIQRRRQLSRADTLFPPEAMTRLFALPKNEATLLSLPGEILLVQTDKIARPDASATPEKSPDTIDAMLTDAMQSLYLSGLHEEYNVKINRSRLEAVISQ